MPIVRITWVFPEHNGPYPTLAYFAMVDSPTIVAFRAALAQRAQGAFDAAAMAPVMFVGASDAAFYRWLPIRATDEDCVSPIQVTPDGPG